ncbi:alcohol dehydrogenase catalytic domain-containing protein [Streptomyces sp. NPDC048254]|uniref:alcohol dehydrogenase catalytic domain-containing protein n=1 Tax=Streptomyces sp. NPDC048254 TaxID=3365525 RepID=UPI00371EBF9F
MRAAVLRGGTVETRIVDDPVPGPGQLLVRSLACGICASDLHFMDHPEAGADDDSGMSTYDQDVDIVMGHEHCAEVVGYGPGTERRIPVGTRVSSLPVLSTAVGRRIIGQNPDAPGGFGEFLLLTEAITRVVVSGLPSEVVPDIRQKTRSRSWRPTVRMPGPARGRAEAEADDPLPGDRGAPRAVADGRRGVHDPAMNRFTISQGPTRPSSRVPTRSTPPSRVDPAAGAQTS